MVRIDDAQDPFMQEVSDITELDGRRKQVTPLTFAETMRIC